MVLTIIQSCLQAGLEVGGWVKTNFITHSDSSEPNLDSEPKLEQNVAKIDGENKNKVNLSYNRFELGL